MWSLESLPRDLRHETSVARESNCALEVDILACDILNVREVDRSIYEASMHETFKGDSRLVRSLAQIWDDAKARRRQAGE